MDGTYDIISVHRFDDGSHSEVLNVPLSRIRPITVLFVRENYAFKIQIQDFNRMSINSDSRADTRARTTNGDRRSDR